MTSSELIAQYPVLRQRRAQLAAYRCFRAVDHGEISRLLNYAAIASVLADSSSSMAMFEAALRLIRSATTLSAHEVLTLSGCGVPEPLLEHARETAACALGVVAAVGGQTPILEALSRDVFGQPGNCAVVAEALVIDDVRNLKDWRARDVAHPVAWVRARAEYLLRESRSGGRIRSADALSHVTSLDDSHRSTGDITSDPYAALIPDWVADVHVRADLQSACGRDAEETQAYALARYLGIPRNCISEFVPITSRQIEAGRVAFERDLPRIQARLRPYREPNAAAPKKSQKKCSKK